VTDTRICTRCHEPRPLSDYNQHSHWCRECRRQQVAAWRRNHGARRHPTEAEECARWRAIDEARARAALERLAAIRECPKCGNVGLQRGRRHDWHSNTLDVWCICGWSDSVATTPSGRVVASIAG
jgi:predicted RNA-binding Zn-ribbon protein involved in translation (DUF1610 family)